MNYLELKFTVTGEILPSNHGYLLFSAMSRLVPDIHQSDWFAMETLPGVARGDGTTQLDPRAKLKVRLPQDRVPLLLKLAGRRLDLDGHVIRLGTPQIFLLQPSSSLHARIVTIKHHQEPETFINAVCQKLEELGVRGEPVIGERRIVRVSGHKVVGFALTLHELSDDGSILLQERGLGGRRHMGCGFFNPVRGIQLPIEKRMPSVTQEQKETRQ